MQSLGAAAASRAEPSRRALNRLGTFALGLCLVGLVILCLDALNPDRISRSTSSPLIADARPDAWEVFLIQFVLGVGAYLASWWPRRRMKLSFALFAVTGLTLTALILGVAAYWNFGEAQTAGFTPLSWTVARFAGDFDSPFPVGADGAAHIRQITTTLANGAPDR